MDDDLLRMLRKACLAVASKEYCSYPEYYDKKKSLLDGHCGVVSYLIYKLFGGCIVTGKIDGSKHYWNRLPDGREVDLTSCQFGGDGINPLKKGRKVKKDMDKDLLNPIYLLYYFEIMAFLKNKSVD